MRRLLLLPVLASFLLAGCGDERPVTVVEPQPPPVVDLPKPNFDARTDLALLHNSKRLRIGDTSTAALALFPMEEGATRIRSLPQGFPSEYTVRGWSIPQEFEGFGVILFQDRVVAAMEQLDNVDEQALTDTIEQYERALGSPEPIVGNGVRYWFWQEEAQTLMISTFETEPGRSRMTIAIGLTTVLSRLGISIERARLDKDAVLQIQRTRAGFPLEPAYSG
jgi:hypothetical protein